MDITEEEKELFRKYQDSKDETVIRQVIEHPWAYNVPVIMWAINVQCKLYKLEEK